MASVMIYVQHLLGIGHLMRARLIAEALADIGCEVHLVSGGMPIGGRMPRGVHTVQLPPIRVADASFMPLRDAQGLPIDEGYRQRRRDALLAAYAHAAPAAVVFETFPFGRRALRFELMPLLERIESTPSRPLVIASVREILQIQQKPEREREMLEWANRWFDAILVHGDPRFARFESTFPLAAELQPPLHYTGFVLARFDPPPARDAPERCEIVVSAGGGAVGIEHLATALAAQRLSRFGHLTWRVLAGPNIPDAGVQRLLNEASDSAIVERARVDFSKLLRGAFISVSQGGYNTVLDVIASGARAVMVPFTGNGETEQRARGERLRDCELAEVVDDRMLSPAVLADAIDRAGIREQWGQWDFDSDGATRSAERIKAMIDAGPAKRRPKEGSLPLGGKAHSAKGAHDPWHDLDDELATWGASGQRATLWWRDDDASRNSPALQRLTALARASEIPLALAVIPAAIEPSLVSAIAQCASVTIVQHGYAHANHAPPGERNWELGTHRQLPIIVAELERGRQSLEHAFGNCFHPVLVPPWNRIDPEVAARLPDAGLHGLSTFGPRAAVWAAQGVVQCNTHVDVVAWRKGRGFIGVEIAIARLVAHLQARREGRVDASEPSGILTHHVDLTDSAWEFLAELMQRTRANDAVTWLDAHSVLPANAVGSRLTPH